MKHLRLAAVTLIFLGAIANAQTSGNGALALSGQLDGSIALFFFSDPSGYTFSIDGLANETMSIGDISAFGTPNGLQANKFTKTLDSDGFHMTTPFLLQVVQANLPSSTGYTLMANLGDNDATVWEVDGVFLSTTPALISPSEPYTAKVQHILYAKFPFTENSVSSLSDTITFIATAN
jgi:hypothetical protein